MIDKKLDLDEIKNISNKIIEKIKETHKDIKINTLTKKEYYKEFASKEKYNLNNFFKHCKVILVSEGFNNLEGDIFVFLDTIKEIEKPEQQIFRLAQVLFHETKHSMQLKYDKFSYFGFYSN